MKQPGVVLLGDIDMVAALAIAHIPCEVVAPPDDPVRWTRRARWLGWADPWKDPLGLLDLLATRGRQGDRPVLFYQTDAATLFVSRHRDALAERYRFVVPEAGLVEDLVDKLRFRRLAAEVGLPVPASVVLSSSSPAPPAERVPHFPSLVKPATRDDSRWTSVVPRAKGIELDSRADLEAWWPTLRAFGGDVLVQELVPGPETSILSYHCYAQDGQVVADFTGRKIRTKPAQYGHTTALTVDYDPQVRRVGREVVAMLRFTGVAKLDFKCDAAGRLHLLEINPRFSLWHHPAARAGVNLPALVWADLVGAERPNVGPPLPGVTWVSPGDLEAALAEGLGVRGWFTTARAAQARSMVSWRDPLPLLWLLWQRARPRSLAPRRH